MAHQRALVAVVGKNESLRHGVLGGAEDGRHVGGDAVERAVERHTHRAVAVVLKIDLDPLDLGVAWESKHDLTGPTGARGVPLRAQIAIHHILGPLVVVLVRGHSNGGQGGEVFQSSVNGVVGLGNVGLGLAENAEFTDGAPLVAAVEDNAHIAQVGKGGKGMLLGVLPGGMGNGYVLHIFRPLRNAVGSAIDVVLVGVGGG